MKNSIQNRTLFEEAYKLQRQLEKELHKKATNRFEEDLYFQAIQSCQESMYTFISQDKNTQHIFSLNLRNQ